MKKQILVFGVTREIAGDSVIEIGEEMVPENAGALLDLLRERYPRLREISSLRIAVNNEFALEDTPINSKDEIALIPPVSGG